MKLNLLIATTLFTLCAAGSYAQVTINQEANIAEAMELKKEVARNESAFQVQIYNGNITEANKTLLEAKNTFKQIATTAILTRKTPNNKAIVSIFHRREHKSRGFLIHSVINKLEN